MFYMGFINCTIFNQTLIIQTVPMLQEIWNKLCTDLSTDSVEKIRELLISFNSKSSVFYFRGGTSLVFPQKRLFLSFYQA